MRWVTLAAVSGALAVAAGAFGAHGLSARVSSEKLEAWNTAARYHLIHSVVLLALSLFGRATPVRIDLPAGLFFGGIILFSGSLYLLVLGGPRWLGPVTPLGGLMLMAAWLSLLTLVRS